MSQRETHAILKDSGGVTVFLTEDNETTWLMDLHEDLDCKALCIESLVHNNDPLTIIAVGTPVGVYVTWLRGDDIDEITEYTLSKTATTQLLNYGECTFANLKRIEASVIYGGTLNVRVYSQELDGFQVDVYSQSTTTALLEYRTALSQVVALTDLEGKNGCSVDSSASIIDVFTLPQQFKYSAPEMVTIPAGINTGYDPDFGNYNHSLDAPLKMGRFGVTNDEMVRVMQWAYDNGKLTMSSTSAINAQGDQQELLDLDDSGCRITWDGSTFGMKSAKGSDYPCVEVTWYGAAAYCNYRSEKEGKTPCYNLNNWSCDVSVNGYRLPTSNEWEYAARGGLSNSRFPWGDTITHSQANYYSSSSYGYDTSSTRGYHPDYDDGGYPYTSPRGTFAPNGYGLYDMAGNAWEWCNTSLGSDQIIRGGNWYNNADRLRCGYKDQIQPTYSSNNIGFRTVCLVPLDSEDSEEYLTFTSDLPIIITTDTAYVVHNYHPHLAARHLFKGDCSEVLHEQVTYNSLHFGDGSETLQIRNLLSTAVYVDKTEDGIFFIGQSGGGETSVNILKITKDPNELADYFGVDPLFEQITKAGVAGPVNNILTAQDIERQEIELLKVYTDESLYLRTGSKITEIFTPNLGLTIGKTTRLSDDSEDIAYGICKTGLVRFSNKEGFTIIPFHNDPTQLDTWTHDYSTTQEYTTTMLDKESIASEHQVLMGTKLDRMENLPVGGIPWAETLTGQFASKTGITFLSSRDQTLALGANTVGVVSLLNRFASKGTLMGGADFINYDTPTTVLMYKTATGCDFYYFNYLDNTPALCQISRTINNYEAITNSGNSTLLVLLDNKIYASQIALFGLVENSGSLFEELWNASSESWVGSNSIVQCHGFVDDGINMLAFMTDVGTLAITRRTSNNFSLAVQGTGPNAALGISSIPGPEVSIVAWNTTNISTYSLDDNCAELDSLTLVPGASIAVSDMALVVSYSDRATVYRKNKTLTEADTVYASVTARPATSLVGPSLVVPVSGNLEVYKWWTGISPEVYFDNNIPTFHVPLKSVDFADDPPYYTRAVIERDLRYQEPITVAYDTTSPAFRSRQVVSNRRLSFLEQTTLTGTRVLSMSTNTSKLLRNSVMWCLGLDPDTLVADDIIVDDEDPYEYSEHVDSSHNDICAMSANPVCGNMTKIESLLEEVSVTGLLIEAKHLLSSLQEDVIFENKIVRTHSREVEDSDQLRVEFGEYSMTSREQAYKTPDFVGEETGILLEGGSYRFWEALWEQSKSSDDYVSQLLDLRQITNGAARVTDITPKVNPAKLLLTHFLANAVITLVRITPKLEDIYAEALDLAGVDSFSEQTTEITDEFQKLGEANVIQSLLDTARSEVDSVPWVHINKTLPASSKCVTVYVIDSITGNSKIINPNL